MFVFNHHFHYIPYTKTALELKTDNLTAPLCVCMCVSVLKGGAICRIVALPRQGYSGIQQLIHALRFHGGTLSVQ